MGLEPDMNLYLDHLIMFMTEAKRVIKETGTIFINLGDTYSQNNSNNGEREIRYGGKQDKTMYAQRRCIGTTRLPNKCLCLIPHRFAIRCTDELGLILRNDLKWLKENGMPESVTDRWSRKSEYIFFFVKHPTKYYFDLDSIREPHKEQSLKRYLRGSSGTNKFAKDKGNHLPPGVQEMSHSKARAYQGYSELSGDEKLFDFEQFTMKDRIKYSSTKIHPEDAEKYGSPRARTHRKNDNTGFGTDGGGIKNHKGNSLNHPLGKNPGEVNLFWNDYKKLSFNDYMDLCAEFYYSEDDGFLVNTKSNKSDHYASFNTDLITKPIIAGSPEGGIILDPFAGTGTTLIRAIQLNRKAIGIEGSKKYYRIAQNNLQNILSQTHLFNHKQ